MTDIGTLHQPFSANYAIGQLGVGKTYAERQTFEKMRESLGEFEGQIITLELGKKIRRRILALGKIADEISGAPCVRYGFGP